MIGEKDKDTRSLESEIKELRKRLDTLIIDLYSADSVCALRKIPDIERRVTTAFYHIITNESEIAKLRNSLEKLRKADKAGTVRIRYQ